MIEFGWNPSEKKLRSFAGVGFFVFGGIGVWIALAGGAGLASGVLWGLAGALAVAGLLRPASLRFFYVLLSLVTEPIRFVFSHLVLWIVYFGLITPTGWLLRLSGRDALGLRPADGTRSYWVPRSRPADAERYFRQS